MFNPLMLKVGTIALSAIAAFGLGWKVCSWKNDSAYKDGYTALVQQLNDANAKNQALENENRANKIEFQKKLVEVANASIKKEVNSAPIYRDCVVPDNSVRLLNDKADAVSKTLSAK